MNLGTFPHILLTPYVPHYGYLPILVMGGKEVYRGEYQRTAIEALTRAQMALTRIEFMATKAAS